MKKYKNIILILAYLSVISTAFSQPGIGSTGNAQTTTGIQDDPNSLSDTALASKLSKDLGSRNSQLGNNPVYWFEMVNGYFGTYQIGDHNYMTFYDNKGTYLKSYKRGNWDNASVPPSLKSAYDRSQFKGQLVTSYWAVSDTGQKGYYLETRGIQGGVSKIYSDGNGTFSTQAPRPTKSPGRKK